MNEYTQKAYLDSLKEKEKTQESSALGAIQYWRERAEKAEFELAKLKAELMDRR